MPTELQLEGVPTQLKSLIEREADRHHRTFAQEAIALLEEAVFARTKEQHPGRDEIDNILDRYEKLPTKDARPMEEVIEYDEFGLPK